MVDLGKIPSELDSALVFLKEHAKDLRGRVSTKGNQIHVEGLKHRQVKLLLHKFLRHRGLNDHRVLSQSGILEIVPPHAAARSGPREATPPSAPATMPYFFPGRSTPVADKRAKRES